MSILGPSDRLAAALDYLGQTIDARAESGDASSSWTAKLLAKGVDACADKAAEEAGEFVAALRGETDERVASEAARFARVARSGASGSRSMLAQPSAMWPPA